MFDQLPVVWQYVILAVGALLATFVGLWLYNRREKRRKHALELMKLMNRWGLDWFAEVYEDYAVGDYSGLVYRVREIVEAVRSDDAMIGKLWDVTQKVASYVVENDPTKADQLRAILAAATPTATTAAHPVAKA